MPSVAQRQNVLASLFSLQTRAIPRRLAGQAPQSRDACEEPPLSRPLAQRVERVWQTAERLYALGMYPALALSIRHRGRLVLNRSIGFRDLQRSSAVDLQTPFCLFSGSKAVTAMLIHLLCEQGYCQLDEPVARWIPEFAAGGKGHVTVRDLLSHRGGIPAIGMKVGADMLRDEAAIIAHLCALPGLEDRRPHYHAVTAGFILGELVRRTTGMTLRDYLRTYVQTPMGMHSFNYGVPAHQRGQVAQNAMSGLRLPQAMHDDMRGILGMSLPDVTALSNEAAFQDAIIPGANLYATAEECSRFFQCLLDGGRFGDRRIFASDTVRRATTEVTPLQRDQVLKLPMRFSAGMMLGHGPVSFFGPNAHEAYGHWGLTNNLCWADPQRHLAVGLLTSGNPVLGTHLPRLFALVGSICALER
jgi:CubicO group peptidase (beta-lactamase class C family)